MESSSPVGRQKPEAGRVAAEGKGRESYFKILSAFFKKIQYLYYFSKETLKWQLM